MVILDAARLQLKRWLRIPVRQTEAYLRSLTDGTFFGSSPGTAIVNPQIGFATRGGILVLDDALPMPDRDAGSRTVFEHIVCLIELGYEVYFWPFDGLDVPRYSHPLRRLGVNIVAGYLRPSLKVWLAARRGIVSHVLLNRPHVAEAHLETLRAANLPILYYGHDLHFARLGMEAEKTGSAAVAAKAALVEQLERRVWRRVAVSSYPSSDEIDRIAVLEPLVVAQPLLAFCFDEFSRRTAVPNGAQIMFVGSFRHPPNVEAADILVRLVFPLVRQEIPEACLVIAGAYATNGIKALAGNGVRVAGWLSDEELANLYFTSRVAAVPLGVGAGIKLKVVEALAKGTPLVTTPVGAQGLPGLSEILPVCDSVEDTVQAIIHMLRLDDDAWLAQSQTELDYARDHFSRDAMKRSIVRCLDLAAVTRPVD